MVLATRSVGVDSASRYAARRVWPYGRAGQSGSANQGAMRWPALCSPVALGNSIKTREVGPRPDRVVSELNGPRSQPVV